MTKPLFRIRHRLVDVGLMLAVERHTGATGVDQLADVVLNASLDNVASSDGVGPVKEFPGTPDARYCRSMKYDFLAFAGGQDILKTADVPVDGRNVESGQNVFATPRHSGDFIALLKQLLN